MVASHKNRAVYYRALAALLGAGAPAAIALKAAADGVSQRSLRTAATDAAFRAGSGVSVAEAMAHHPDVFDVADVSLLRAGEASGSLDQTLLRLAEDAEITGSIRRRLAAGFAYPVFLWHFAAVVPPLAHLIRDGFMAWFLRVLALLFPLYLVVAVLWWLGASTKGRVVRNRLLSGVPLIGKALKHASLARFLRVLAGCLDAGMGAVESATTALASNSRPDLREGGRNGLEVLAKGRSFTEFFAYIGALSANDRGLLRAGEESGTLVENLRVVASQREDEARYAAEAAVRWIPLVVYLFVAGYVAFTVISMYGQMGLF